MASGSCRNLDELPPDARRILDEARRASMATVGADGAPHVVPICFAVRGAEIISAIDHKPKQGTVMARVRNIERDPRVTLTADRWDEDWTRVGWVMIRAMATVEPPVDTDALNARYPQYADMPEHDALIVLRPDRLLWWTWS